MDKAVKRRWLEALQSGEYRKTTQGLRVKGRYCCLGVLCDIQVRAGVEWLPNGIASFAGSISSAVLPEPLMDAVGITGNEEAELIDLNDSERGWSHVIQYIRKNL